MIETYEKFRIEDQDKKNDFFIEVNWSDDKDVKECRILKITFPNGEKAFIKRENLNAMLFAIGRKEDQRKMIPQKIETVHHYKTVLGIKATKDIHKGENINFPVEMTVPCSFTKEMIGEFKPGKILTPHDIHPLIK